ncbi:MAG TPA: hypothetical protein VGB85_05545, partial [Nannocystis sp.]
LVGKPANSDAHPILDTGAEKARFMQDAAGFLHSLRWTPAPLLSVLGGLERRPYPPGGIGDERAPHVFLETEQAAALMRLYEDPTTSVAPALSVTAMNLWIDEQRKVEAELPDWDEWIKLTYGIYTEVAPHIDLPATRWWTEVRNTVKEHDAPLELISVIDTLDALQMRDGPRLQRGLGDLRARGSRLLSEGMTSIAGMIALELQGADAASRRAFAAEHMSAVTASDEPSAENLAYRALRAHTER